MLFPEGIYNDLLNCTWGKGEHSEDLYTEFMLIFILRDPNSYHGSPNKMEACGG